MNTLQKAIKLREHMTGEGEGTFDNARFKDKWLSLAEVVEFKEETATTNTETLGICLKRRCYNGAVIGSDYCLWHRMENK